MLLSANVVSRRSIIEAIERGLILKEVASKWSPAKVQALIDTPLAFSPDRKKMTFSSHHGIRVTN